MIELIVIICICCFISIRSTAYLLETGSILKKGVLAEGKVIGNEKKHFMFLFLVCPIIEFTTASGNKIKGVFKPIWITRKFPKEERVMVVYDPKKPYHFFIDNRYVDLVNFTLLSLSVSALLLALYKLST
jgi:hypothetical protein